MDVHASKLALVFKLPSSFNTLRSPLTLMLSVSRALIVF